MNDGERRGKFNYFSHRAQLVNKYTLLVVLDFFRVLSGSPYTFSLTTASEASPAVEAVEASATEHTCPECAISFDATLLFVSLLLNNLFYAKYCRYSMLHIDSIR